MSIKITCPKCNHEIELNKTDTAKILKELDEQVISNKIAEERSKWEQEKKKDIELEKNKLQTAYNETFAKLTADNQILKMKHEQEIKQAVSEYKQELDKLKSQSELAKKNFEEQLKTIISIKDDEIKHYKELKSKLSTKMVGETLERHCEIEFEQKIRPFVTDKKVEFSKDNVVVDGTKGDYVYRETTENGVEVISIMFEMKNEEDTTSTKKKNDDFLEKLHKDREKKGCEYAVLVSLLEPDNELYNVGIVDKSYLYPKMYVIRPQFFVSLISLLRNASYNALEYKNELALVKNQNIDITNFEENLKNYQAGFKRNTELFRNKFQSAINEIDKAIKALQNTKEELLSSDRNLRLADEKIQDLSIKKLTKNNPTMAELFEKIKEKKQIELEETAI